MLPFTNKSYPIELTSAEAILIHIRMVRHEQISETQVKGIYTNAVRQLATTIRDEHNLTEREFNRKYRIMSYAFGPETVMLTSKKKVRALVVKIAAGLHGASYASKDVGQSYRARHVWYVLNGDNQIVDCLIPERDLENPETRLEPIACL